MTIFWYRLFQCVFWHVAEKVFCSLETVRRVDILLFLSSATVESDQKAAKLIQTVSLAKNDMDEKIVLLWCAVQLQLKAVVGQLQLKVMNLLQHWIVRVWPGTLQVDVAMVTSSSSTDLPESVWGLWRLKPTSRRCVWSVVKVRGPCWCYWHCSWSLLVWTSLQAWLPHWQY